MALPYHIPVLLHDVIKGLQINPKGVYVDATFGGGGHSKEILKHLKEGQLIAFDQDEDAVKNEIQDNRFVLVHHNFKYMQRFLSYLSCVEVDGILADLGISSHQIDEEKRGFSFQKEGPLDMRMSNVVERNASQYLSKASELDLVRVFSEYGEVRNAKTVARKLVQARKQGVHFTTTGQLAQFLSPLAIGEERRYLAQVFQALRIEINGELDVLKSFLTQSLNVLKPGGRLVVLTYHSLEDRIVKQFMKKGSFNDEIVDEYGRRKTVFRLVNKKPIEADHDEVKRNPRARSARLRIAEKQ